jgi:DHA3 family tetracycline resistance protein-like MFS transporter
VLADTFSRRLSVIVGTFLLGLGRALEAITPAFAAILAGEVVRGFGYT